MMNVCERHYHVSLHGAIQLCPDSVTWSQDHTPCRFDHSLSTRFGLLMVDETFDLPQSLKVVSVSTDCFVEHLFLCYRLNEADQAQLLGGIASVTGTLSSTTKKSTW